MPQTASGQEAQAKGALAQARAALSLAERNYERYKALAASGSASPLELDMSRMQYEQAKGAVQQGEGAVEAASSVARESRVTAPFAGRVAARLVEAGDLAAPGRPLVMVESATGRRLVVQVPAGAVAASGLKAGQKLAVKIDGVAAELTGTVVEMSPGADPASHTYTATLELAGTPVSTGLTGRATLDTAPRATVLVPESAVLTSGGVTLVAVKDEAGKARTRAVTTGAVSGGKVEILSGLSGGETVLVGLASPPADGAPVSELKGSSR
ncbi:MAG: efflux RND transporter periplasmic adaptor subunit [Acidobacteria bacterium]|nr:efflux RND transporter periplasmic adaptor subunit [Acidobacteriota bacterium]